MTKGSAVRYTIYTVRDCRNSYVSFRVGSAIDEVLSRVAC